MQKGNRFLDFAEQIMARHRGLGFGFEPAAILYMEDVPAEAAEPVAAQQQFTTNLYHIQNIKEENHLYKQNLNFLTQVLENRMYQKLYPSVEKQIETVIREEMPQAEAKIIHSVSRELQKIVEKGGMEHYEIIREKVLSESKELEKTSNTTIREQEKLFRKIENIYQSSIYSNKNYIDQIKNINTHKHSAQQTSLMISQPTAVHIHLEPTESVLERTLSVIRQYEHPQLSLEYQSDSIETAEKVFNTETLQTAERLLHTDTEKFADKIQNTETLKTLEKVFNTETLKKAEKVFNTETLKAAEKVLNTETIKSAEKVLNTKTLQTAERLLHTDTEKAIEKVFNTETLKKVEKVFNTETLKTAEKVLNTETLLNTDIVHMADPVHLEYPAEETANLQQEIIQMVQHAQYVGADSRWKPLTPEIPKAALERIKNQELISRTKTLSEQVIQRIENNGIVTMIPQTVQEVEQAPIVYRFEDTGTLEQQQKTKQLEAKVNEVVKTIKQVEEKTIVQKEQIIEQQKQVVKEVIKSNPVIWSEGDSAGYLKQEIQHSLEEQLNQNVNQIANKVYRQLENKLKSERGRRGLI